LDAGNNSIVADATRKCVPIGYRALKSTAKLILSLRDQAKKINPYEKNRTLVDSTGLIQILKDKNLCEFV